ncbi:MAG TPA: heme-degrading domain-containing protein [Ilumatobacteraceae bacterium]
MSDDPLANDLAALAEQEQRIIFDVFDNDTAWVLGVQMVDAARSAGLAVVVSITRNGQRLFHAALNGTSPDNDAWVERKSRVVTRFGHSSLHVGAQARAAGSTFEERSRLDPDEYAAHGGSFPITVRGVGVVGAVTVSGLPQVEDHRFVVQQLEQFVARWA